MKNILSKKLTEKQKLFCKYYLINLNATDAAIKAGYSKKSAEATGYENLRKPSIHKEIQDNLAKRANEAGITAAEVLNNLKKAIAISLGEVESFIIVKEGSGKGETYTSSVPMKRTDINAFIKINELYMRHLGMFNDKLEISVDDELAQWLMK